jgi:pimeloyl-ACP methyl ester carboxylesterase
MAKAAHRDDKKSLLALTCDEMEQRLAASGDDPELRAYFGDEVYADLKLKLKSPRGTRATRAVGPRVLILHGIMGSLLGRPRWGWDAIWLNPEAIVQGQLSKLSLNRPPGTSDVKTLDVLPLYYTALRIWLRDAGMNADFFAYDWRQSVEDLGWQLEAALAKDPATQISLVAHSMGGLVSRSAVKINGPGIHKVNRIVMLGTPNFGSFVPAQVLCVQYPFVNDVIALDVTQSNVDLTRQVFSSFPSLYQMLPSHAPGRYVQQDMFDSTVWPGQIPKLDTRLLADARIVQSGLPADDPRFRLIAGVDQETVTSVEKGNASTFAFNVTNEGDGTVPVFLAKLTEITPTWYVKESHGGLPRNREVGEAVIEILQSAEGKTTVLPNSWGSTRGAKVSRRKLEIRSTSEKRDGSTLTNADKQRLLESVFGPRPATPSSSAPPDVPPTAIPPKDGGASDTPPPGTPSSMMDGDDGRQQFGGIVVGRRKRRLEIVLAHGSIADVPANAYVLGLFEGVTPSGAADALDQRSNGLIRDFYTRHVIDGALGKVSLVPTNCTALMSDMVAFVGLGGFGDFTPDRQLVGAASVIKTLVKLRVPDFATVLIGETMCAHGGDEDRSASEALKQLLKGFLVGLRDSDSEHLLHRIVFCVHDLDKYESLKGQFYGLAATKLFDDIELVFDEMKVKPLVQDTDRRDARSATAALPGEDDSPSYLMATDYSRDPNTAGLKFAFLTASGRGSLPSATVEIDRKELDALLDKFDPDVGLTSQDNLTKLGDQLARRLFPDDFVAKLVALDDIKQAKPLRLVHDAPTSVIPWEAL